MNNSSIQSSNSNLTEEEGFDLKKFLNTTLAKWPWLLLSVVLCLSISVFYYRYTAPSYQITARVYITDNERAGGVQGAMLMDISGLLGAKNSVDNEVEILRTRFLMEQVVREMQLNIVYHYKSNLIKRELYQAPFKLTVIRGLDSIPTVELGVQKLGGSKLKVTAEDFEKVVSWEEPFEVKDLGLIKISPQAPKFLPDTEYFVQISSIDSRTSEMLEKVTVASTSKMVSIIDLGLNYGVPRKGEEILNTLIGRYIQSNLADKNAIADSTSKFIKERVGIIAGELGDVENKVTQYKQKYGLADLTLQGKALIESSGNVEAELAKAEIQVAVLTDLEKYLKDDTKNKKVFPASVLPQDIAFTDLLRQYNALLTERDRLSVSLTPESPFIQNLDTRIATLRTGILENLQSSRKSYQLTRNKLRSQLADRESQISEVPEREKDYLRLARNREIKQALYIFLMQKAEETDISKAANKSIAKVIDPPKAAFFPISPRRNQIYALGFLFGLIIPLGLIYLSDLFKTTIVTKEDIISLTDVPVIGEISHNDTSDNTIVASNGRSAISEQFRALRTNLSFYLKSKNEKTILLTSSMSGEGKSFTAINLGNIVALTGKRVLLMELDLRKPGLSAKLEINNDLGFSNYTINEDIKISDIVKPLAINKNMFIISSGPLPPNPAETLLSERTAELIEELKKEFDYIIMDAPPVGIIADAQLLSPYADVVLYLVRPKVTKKEQLNIVDELHRSNKMKNIGIVVNDIVSKYYGYGYGYGNGYGDYGQTVKTSFLKSLFKKLKP